MCWESIGMGFPIFQTCMKEIIEKKQRSMFIEKTTKDYVHRKEKCTLKKHATLLKTKKTAPGAPSGTFLFLLTAPDAFLFFLNVLKKK